MMRWILPLVLFAGAGLARADDKKPTAPKPEPEATPLELTITGKTTKYTLDTGGMSAAEYKKNIETAAAAKGRVRLPAAPAVDLTLEIKNTSDKAVTVWTSGDPVVLTLTVKGKGAINAQWAGPMTLEFRLPKGVEIEAGKTHTIAIKSLTSGVRGNTHFAYWTEPGEYELVAALKTGMNPAPKGAKEAMDGFGQVTVTSPAFKVTVEEKK
jgi:hypothetical protein